jgi:hypothetical protein
VSTKINCHSISALAKNAIRSTFEKLEASDRLRRFTMNLVVNGVPGEYLPISSCPDTPVCPVVFRNGDAPEEKVIMITDDFAGRIFMSEIQFRWIQDIRQK